MIANQRGANLLVVGDTPHFGRVVAAILGNARQRHTTYEGFRGMFSPRLLGGTDLFVLELWRSYPTGLRPEGLALAEELEKPRCRVIFISFPGPLRRTVPAMLATKALVSLCSLRSFAATYFPLSGHAEISRSWAWRLKTAA